MLAAALCYTLLFHRGWTLDVLRRLRPGGPWGDMLGLLLLFLLAAAGLAAVMTVFFVLLGQGALQMG